MRTVLSPETWNDIRTAYMAGENARALARQWRISTSAIYKRAATEGWAKLARAPSATDDPFAPEAPIEHEATPGSDLMLDVLMGESHDAGFLAHLALGASGDALRNYDFSEARTLLRLADDYTRVAKRQDSPNLHILYRALFDREYADSLFALEEGERNFVKEAYQDMMKEVDAATAKRQAADAGEVASTPAAAN